MSAEELSFSKARYAKGQIAVHCTSPDGYKTRGMRLCEHLKARWSNRERRYIMSPAKAEKLKVLFRDGRDANTITKELYPL